MNSNRRHGLRRYLLLWLAACLSGCFNPPRIESEEGAKAAEALYTAVTSRRTELLDQCEQRMTSLHAAGKLSEVAHDEMKQCVSLARTGNWQQAAERVDWLIRHQPVTPQ